MVAESGMRPTPKEDYSQMEHAAFYEVGRPTHYEPVDVRAIYGLAAERVYRHINAPVRKAPRDLVTAIRTAREGDRVRVNAGGWMDVTGTDDEGFTCVYEDGSVEYAVWPTNPSDNPPGTFDRPWMRRVEGWRSEGAVECLEVDWALGPRR